MNELAVAVIMLAVVALATSAILCFTKYSKKRYKSGVIVIPVTDKTENAEYAVKSAYFDETFDNTTYRREILIVDFGCSPQVWEYYQKLAERYRIVRAINSHELCAYLKAKTLKIID